MTQFIGTSMQRGFQGDLTRGYFDHTTEILPNDSTTPVAAFGVPVKLNATGTAVSPTAATADVVYGFSVRQYGQADCEGEQPMGFVTILKRGYIAVALATGTVKRGDAVYLDASGAITATSDSNTAIPGAYFMGPAEGGLVEIAFNI